MTIAVALVALAVSGGAAAASGTDARQSGFETIEELMARYRAYAESLRDLPPDIRSAKAKREFFGALPWDEICFLCRKDSSGAAPGEGKGLQDLVLARLQGRPATIEQISSLLEDPRYSNRCKKGVVMYLYAVKDSLRGVDGVERLARALLNLADSGTVDRGIAAQLEHAAAYLWASDDLMRRMMAHCYSSEDWEVEQGLSMLKDARDPRASDSLVVAVEHLVETAWESPLLGKAFMISVERLGGRMFDLMAQVYRESLNPLMRRTALKALARTGDRRFYGILLDAYASSPFPYEPDSLQKRTPAYAHFYGLWEAARFAEPAMMRDLESGKDAEACSLAIRILDLESRFGLPENRPEIYEVLERFAARHPEYASKVEEIVRRFRSYPDPVEKG